MPCCLRLRAIRVAPSISLMFPLLPTDLSLAESLGIDGRDAKGASFRYAMRARACGTTQGSAACASALPSQIIGFVDGGATGVGIVTCSANGRNIDGDLPARRQETRDSGFLLHRRECRHH